MGFSQDWESREGQGHNRKTLECLTRLSDSLHFSRTPLLWVLITVITGKQWCLELGRNIRVDEVFLESLESTQLKQGSIDTTGSETRV